METKSNAVGWFEIPVKDLGRAKKFYESVFNCTLETSTINGTDYAWWPHTPNGGGAGGSLVKNEDMYKPSKEGVLIYFTTPTGDMKKDMEKVKAAGGKVEMEKTLIAEDIGYMGIFTDTEGNRIAIHSRE